ncbi:hypothetical protein BJY52DRAFT_1417047 [Lactarius psammicola]|nr:hypothetical protein BJY52DRAFT_1417047 [Lactarius psammicola]
MSSIRVAHSSTAFIIRILNGLSESESDLSSGAASHIGKISQGRRKKRKNRMSYLKYSIFVEGVTTTHIILYGNGTYLRTTPVRKNLGIWPAFPIIGDYQYLWSSNVMPNDEDNIIAALEHPDRGWTPICTGPSHQILGKNCTTSTGNHLIRHYLSGITNASFVHQWPRRA